MDFITNFADIKKHIDSGNSFFIFKHSTQCPISASAHDAFELFVKLNPEVLHVAVKVIEDREVSNQIGEVTGVQHQSPQAILMQGEKVLWHDSHRSLTKEVFEKQWNSHNNS
jgi:bacillithiol system protein YtxJ